jgi:hypothetical protein
MMGTEQDRPGGTKSMPLEIELETFRNLLPSLLKDPKLVGRFVLIHGEAVDSDWATLDDALKAGYARFDLEPFLIKQVVEHEEPVFFSRRVKPCP